MDKAAEGWLKATAKKMHWRVRGVADAAELVQDGLMLWHVIAARYPNAKLPAQKMVLFKAAFQNHITSLSRKNSRCPSVVLAADIDLDLSLVPDSADEYVAKPEPTEVVQRLINECASRPHRFKMPRRCNETESEWLSRVAGFSVPDDAHLQLLAYMRG